MFHSKDVVIILVFMQYTNNILDLLVTIGYNIQLMVANSWTVVHTLTYIVTYFKYKYYVTPSNAMNK